MGKTKSSSRSTGKRRPVMPGWTGRQPHLPMAGAPRSPAGAMTTTCQLKTPPPNPPEIVAALWPEALDFMSPIKALYAL